MDGSMGLSREVWTGNANLGIPKSGLLEKDSEMEICSFACGRTMSMEEMDSSGAGRGGGGEGPSQLSCFGTGEAVLISPHVDQPLDTG